MDATPMRRRRTSLIAAAALLIGGCAADGTSSDPRPPASSGTNDSASPGATPSDAAVTLEITQVLSDMPDQLIAWAVQVQRASGGSIAFDVASSYRGDGDGDPESQLVADVQAGTVDLAWVGARALPGFEALLAPMLVDSHEFQEAVFEQRIPGRMLADLEIDGITGLGVLPGPMRRMLGNDRDFRTVEDFAGTSVMSDNTPQARATMDALGVASVVPGVAGAPLDHVNGLVAHVGAVLGNGYERTAQSFTTNLNLWPRPLVLIINTEIFERLSPAQQESLSTAAAESLPALMAATRSEDFLPGRPDLLSALCSSGLELIELSDADRAGIRAAVEPVYERLAQDATAGAYLTEIQALKDRLGSPPEGLSCDGAD